MIQCCAIKLCIEFQFREFIRTLFLLAQLNLNFTGDNTQNNIAMTVVKIILSYILITLTLSRSVVSEHMELDKFVFREDSCELQNFSSSSELTNILTNLIADHTGFKYTYYNGYRYLSHFKEINCINTKLDHLPSMLFEEFSKLKILHASNIELKEIIRDDFKFAEYLTDLDLSKNNLTHLENKIFMHLRNLEKLDLSGNQISSVHDGAFEEISRNISSVDLSYNKIEEFNESHLIALTKNLSADLLIVNLENNCISKISQINSTIFGNEKIKLLNLQNNKIKSFESSKLQINELKLNNNQLEKLLFIPTVKFLEVNNNKLKELFIVESMRNVTAINNEIRVLKCDKSLSIEFLNLSGNEITNEVFVELKHADKLKVLDLSNTPLSALRVDSFAEMKSLEKLNLGSTRMMKISFGLFSHQRSLQFLNISHNDLRFIDYHMFTSLSNLKSWDISGNNLTKLKEHEKLREIFPKLTLITLDENNWNCEYLSKLILNLTKQRIKIADPLRPVKNDSSLNGIGCLTHEHLKTNENDDEHSPVEMKMTMDQMYNINFEKQELLNDQLLNKIDEQRLEVAKLRTDQSSVTALEVVLLVIGLLILIALVFITFPHMKNYVKRNLQRMRSSRQSSVNTIATFENSVL